MKYEALSVDGKVRDRVTRILEAFPQGWKNRRDLYHDVLRRGLLDVEQELNLAPSSAPPPAPVAKAGPPPESEGIPSPEGEARGRSTPSPRRPGSGASAGSVEELPPTPEAASVHEVHSAADAARDGDDVELDLPKLAKTVNARIRAGISAERGRTPRDVQIAIVQLEAERTQGVTLNDVDAAEVLEKVLDPQFLAQFRSPRSSRSKGAAAG